MSTPLPLHDHFPNASRLVLGCMGLGGGWNTRPIGPPDLRTAEVAIEAAREANINVFDHADIYAFGKAEQVFGQWLQAHPEQREKIFLQSKGGIRCSGPDGTPKRYDLSRDWILSCVEGTLQRLHTDYLDAWLIHRPDPLMEPEEIAEAFQILKTTGKVRQFGVSNMHGHQLRLLQAVLPDPLAINQLSISLAQLDWLEEGILAGNPQGQDVYFSPGTLEYCRLNHVQIQSWGSLAHGLFSGQDVRGQSARIQAAAEEVARLAQQYGVSREAIVLGWLRRHPARIQPVFGSTNPERIRACAQAEQVWLNRDDWVTLYVRARGRDLP